MALSRNEHELLQRVDTLTSLPQTPDILTDIEVVLTAASDIETHNHLYPEATLRLANFLSDQHRFDEALDAYEQVRNNDTFMAFPQNSARFFDNLGALQWDMRRWDAAMDSHTQAITIRRTLAATDPGAYNPGLAMSLNNLGRVHSSLGQWNKAAAALMEDVTLYRSLSAERPVVYSADFAWSLSLLIYVISDETSTWRDAYPGDDTLMTELTGLLDTAPESVRPEIQAAIDWLNR